MLSYKEYDNALAVEIVIKGFVSTQEFEDTAKKLEAFIARHGKVNVLEVIEDFEGMDGTAFWQDFKFSLAHLNDFSRCAMRTSGGQASFHAGRRTRSAYWSGRWRGGSYLARMTML